MSAAALVIMAATASWRLTGAQPIRPDRSILASFGSHGLSHAIEAPPAGDAALLRLRRVPAGDYAIAASDERAAKLALNVNRNDPLLESASTPLTVHFPVALSTLSVRTDGPSGLRLRPLRVAAPINPDGRSAIRAARYGRARVFFFDDRAYPERGGFWTRGEGRVTVVIDADDEAARQSGLPLTFTGGAAATTIGISVGDWSRSYSLTPGQRRDVTLPPARGRAWVVDIHSGPGFRPFSTEPGNPDVRLLAAWFEIP